MPLLTLPTEAPHSWPRFRNPLRSTAITARVGRLLGICFATCFVTGLLSHYQYHPWSWLPEPSSPAWGYRITQGVHVVTGTATIPLLLVKLWSVYPNLFRWPPLRSLLHAIERASVFLLVSTAILQLVTGFLNVLNWYPWPWNFVKVHFLLAFVVMGSILVHVAVKLPDIRYGLSVQVGDGDVLTEVPWSENPHSFSNAGPLPPPTTEGISRRGLLLATGASVSTVVLTFAGQTVTPLEDLGLLAPRQPHRGPQGLAVNKTAAQAGVQRAATSPNWRLGVVGPRSYALSLHEILAVAWHDAELPISCVEGWSADAHWRGVRLIDVVRRAGGDASSQVRVESLQGRGAFNHSTIEGPLLRHALLATHLNGEPLDLDHGYPLRLIAPDRAGVLNTKWLSRLVIR